MDKEELEIKRKELATLEEEIAVLRLNKWNVFRISTIKKLWRINVLCADIKELGFNNTHNNN